MSNEVQTEGKEAVKRRASPLPKTLVNQIKREYLEGKGSIRELSEKYGVPERPLQVRCTRESWRVSSEQIVEKAVQVVQKQEVSRLERLHAHEERMISRMEKRLVSVDKSLDQVGDLVEPQDLKAIVGTESTVDQVIRRSLGANDKPDQQAPVTVNILNILAKLKESKAPERTIDVEAEVSELKEMVKLLTEET